MDAYYIYIGDLRDADDLIGIDPKDNPFRVMGLPGKNILNTRCDETTGQKGVKNSSF